MEKINFEGSLKEALVGLRHYFDLQVKYQKLVFTKKLSELSSYLVIFLLLLGISAFILVFLSLSFIEWYATFGERLHGRLFVTSFYFLLGVIIVIFRQGLIFSPMRKMFGNIFLGDDDDPKTKASYKSKEVLDLQIVNFKDIIKAEEEDLKEKFERVEEGFTFLNIIQGIARSAYRSFLTASNVAKATYSLFSRFRGGKKKNKKKGNTQRPELEEEN